MSEYSEYFLNSDSNVVELELIEISHPSFSKVYCFVRNAINGITVTLEDASVKTFDYFPLSIKPTGVSDDLDQTLDVQLGELGTVIPQELDLVSAAGTFNVKPTLIYRTYRSDDLSAPLNGPLRFVISNLTSNSDGSSFQASAPKLNNNSTGQIYSIDRFPMLRGFL